MKRAQVSEQDVAAIVVDYLEQLGADVYQEVECQGGVADLVARVGAEIWIVEVKTSFSLALLLQAMDRRRCAHRVVIAAPYTRNIRDVGVVCEALGIGVWQVRVPDPSSTWEQPEVRQLVTSARHNRRPVELAKRLEPGHKTHAKAGAVGAAGRWTPFRRTCEALAAVVSREPGVLLKQAIDQIEHHYATDANARSSMLKWIEVGRVPGVELRRTNGAALLYPRAA